MLSPTSCYFLPHTFSLMMKYASYCDCFAKVCKSVIYYGLFQPIVMKYIVPHVVTTPRGVTIWFVRHVITPQSDDTDI